MKELVKTPVKCHAQQHAEHQPKATTAIPSDTTFFRMSLFSAEFRELSLLAIRRRLPGGS